MAPTASAPPVPSRQTLIVVIQVALLVVALIVYALRVYTRARIVRALGLDDMLMGVAVILTIFLSVGASVGTRFGWGLHGSDISPENKAKAVLVTYIAEIFYTVTVSVVKISVLVFYLRLANTKVYRRIMFGTMGFVGLWMVVFTNVTVFAYWDPRFAPGSRCVNENLAMGVQGITNILTDLFVVVLPMPMLWGVQLPRRQRIGLIALFSFGGLVCIGCAMRLYYSIVVSSDHDNGTWTGLYLWTWESVELDLGIACASIPALKPLISMAFPRFFGSEPSAASGDRVSSAKRSDPVSRSYARGEDWEFRHGGGGSGKRREEIGLRLMLDKDGRRVRTGGGKPGLRRGTMGSVSGSLRSVSVTGGDGGTKPTSGWKRGLGKRGIGESEESLARPESRKGIIVSTEIECKGEEKEEVLERVEAKVDGKAKRILGLAR